MQNNTYRYFVIATLIVLLTVGIIMGYKFGKEVAREDNIGFDIGTTIAEESVLPFIEEDDVVVNAEPVINSEFKIVKRFKYTDCKHEEYDEDTVIASNIDDVLNESYNDYEIISKTDKSAIVEKTINGYCNNHFVIKKEEDKIIVYRLISKDEKEVYYTVNASFNTLRDDVKKDLEKGIDIDSIDKLNQIIQEIES